MSDINESFNKWLQQVADDATEHVEYIEKMETKDPEGLNADDYKYIDLEHAFLILYALHKQDIILEEAVKEIVEEEDITNVTKH